MMIHSTPTRWAVVFGSPTWLILMMATSTLAADPTAAIGVPAIAEKTKSAELSVAPLDHIEYPEDRPSWLEDRPSDENGEHQIVVVSSPSETVEESLEDLRWMQRAAVATYVSNLVDAGGEFDFYSPSDEEIDRDFVTKRYSGTLTQGDATRYESAVELRFTDAKRAGIQAAWKNIEVGDRLKSLGGLMSMGLVLLMCSNGLVGIVSRRFAKSSSNPN